MAKQGFFWSTVIVFLMSALLWLNFSIGSDYVKIRKYPSIAPGTVVTCKNFLTQKDAQDFFIANGGPGIDKYNLDGDKDGRVCESLP
ncbi:MAG: hypothetical protein ACD_31C00055G0003 [uncultured bacterium]|nr:MAG: hypothetical protein ACD_31C00055G0003 [uncultured bacterium]